MVAPLMDRAFNLVHVVPTLVHPVCSKMQQVVKRILVALLCSVSERLPRPGCAMSNQAARQLASSARAHRGIKFVLVVDVGAFVHKLFEPFQVVRAGCVVNRRHLVVVGCLDVSTVLMQHVDQVGLVVQRRVVKSSLPLWWRQQKSW